MRLEKKKKKNFRSSFIYKELFFSSTLLNYNMHPSILHKLNRLLTICNVAEDIDPRYISQLIAYCKFYYGAHHRCRVSPSIPPTSHTFLGRPSNQWRTPKNKPFFFFFLCARAGGLYFKIWKNKCRKFKDTFKNLWDDCPQDNTWSRHCQPYTWVG